MNSVGVLSIYTSIDLQSLRLIDKKLVADNLNRIISYLDLWKTIPPGILNYICQDEMNELNINLEGNLIEFFPRDLFTGIKILQDQFQINFFKDNTIDKHDTPNYMQNQGLQQPINFNVVDFGIQKLIQYFGPIEIHKLFILNNPDGTPLINSDGTFFINVDNYRTDTIEFYENLFSMIYNKSGIDGINNIFINYFGINNFITIYHEQYAEGLRSYIRMINVAKQLAFINADELDYFVDCDFDNVHHILDLIKINDIDWWEQSGWRDYAIRLIIDANVNAQAQLEQPAGYGQGRNNPSGMFMKQFAIDMAPLIMKQIIGSGATIDAMSSLRDASYTYFYSDEAITPQIDYSVGAQNIIRFINLEYNDNINNPYNLVLGLIENDIMDIHRRNFYPEIGLQNTYNVGRLISACASTTYDNF